MQLAQVKVMLVTFVFTGTAYHKIERGKKMALYPASSLSCGLGRLKELVHLVFLRSSYTNMRDHLNLSNLCTPLITILLSRLPRQSEAKKWGICFAMTVSVEAEIQAEKSFWSFSGPWLDRLHQPCTCLCPGSLCRCHCLCSLELQTESCRILKHHSFAF